MRLQAKARRWARISWFLLFLSFLTMGCPQVPPPKDQVTDPAELLRAVKEATGQIRDARLKEVRMDYFGEQGRLSLRQTLLFQQPDRLRVQTYVPGFEGTAGVLVCACGRFAYHDQREQVFYHGDATPENLGSVLTEGLRPLGLSCADLGALLLGGAPHERLAAAGGTPTLAWDGDTGRYRWETLARAGKDQGARIELQVRHGDWRVAALRVVEPGGQLRYEYRAEDFEMIGGHAVPQERRFVVPATGDDLSLRAGETQVNPGLPEELFRLAPPDGAPIRYIGAGEARAPSKDGDLCEGAKAPSTNEAAPTP